MWAYAKLKAGRPISELLLEDETTIVTKSKRVPLTSLSATSQKHSSRATNRLEAAQDAEPVEEAEPEALKDSESTGLREPLEDPEPAKEHESAEEPESAKKPESTEEPEYAKKPEPSKQPKAKKRAQSPEVTEPSEQSESLLRRLLDDAEAVRWLRSHFDEWLEEKGIMASKASKAPKENKDVAPEPAEVETRSKSERSPPPKSSKKKTKKARAL